LSAAVVASARFSHAERHFAPRMAPTGPPSYQGSVSGRAFYLLEDAFDAPTRGLRVTACRLEPPFPGALHLVQKDDGSPNEARSLPGPRVERVGATGAPLLFAYGRGARAVNAAGRSRANRGGEARNQGGTHADSRRRVKLLRRDRGVRSATTARPRTRRSEYLGSTGRRLG
jgi:hypothetical protein